VLLVILQHTPVLPWIIQQIEPLMGVFGLRGEAAVPLVLGNALNLYAAIAGILSLELTVKEVFILAVMLSFSHNMFIETGIALKVGVKLWVVLLVRFGFAALSAIVVNLVWQGGGEVAVYGLAPPVTTVPDGWIAIVMLGLQKAFWGVVQLAAIAIPLIISIQYLKDYQYLEKFSRRMAPMTRALGIHPNASMTLVTGLVVGLVYGAGVMIRAVKDDGVSRKDATLTFLFLIGCHAVVEDTLLFVPLGIPVWPLLVLRLVTAVIFTMVVAAVWNRMPEGATVDDAPSVAVAEA
jgi:Fe2+ transport system protein B